MAQSSMMRSRADSRTPFPIQRSTRGLGSDFRNQTRTSFLLSQRSKKGAKCRIRDDDSVVQHRRTVKAINYEHLSTDRGTAFRTLSSSNFIKNAYSCFRNRHPTCIPSINISGRRLPARVGVASATMSARTRTSGTVFCGHGCLLM
jgi:hypothetical protein